MLWVSLFVYLGLVCRLKIGNACRPQHFPFSGRAGKPFQGKTGCPQGLLDDAFHAVSDQNATRTQCLMQTGENFGRP